jgi:hypothetical protein
VFHFYCWFFSPCINIISKLIGPSNSAEQRYKLVSFRLSPSHDYITAGVPVLGPVGSSGYYAITGGHIQSTTDHLYLNAATNASTSYKALSWSTTPTTSAWGMPPSASVRN